MTTLRVRDLSVRIGGTDVVRDVSFDIAPGERVGLIGESGSGKSLTALAVMGLLPDGARARGMVEVAGEPVLGMGERRLAALRGNRLSMVFQEPMTALDPMMQVGRQVAAAVALHGDVSRGRARERALELLTLVELPDPARAMRAYPHQLSGGQRQRVVLAMALANDPALLICDEPTTALDVTVQSRMLALVERLVARMGTALLFITHDLAVVSNLCDRVVVMYGGRVVEDGPIEQVFTTPHHPYTAGLLAASDVADVPPGERLRTIPGSVPEMGGWPVGCPFRGRCDHASELCTDMPPLEDDGTGRSVACFHPVDLAVR